MLIELKDGGIKEIYTDEWNSGGCPTCDHGSEYINEFRIELTTGNINVEINKMYDYAMSTDYMLKLFLINIDSIKQKTEKEFYEWIVQKLNEEFKSVDQLTIDFKESYQQESNK